VPSRKDFIFIKFSPAETLPGHLSVMKSHQVNILISALRCTYEVAMEFDSRPGLKFLLQKVTVLIFLLWVYEHVCIYTERESWVCLCVCDFVCVLLCVCCVCVLCFVCVYVCVVSNNPYSIRWSLLLKISKHNSFHGQKSMESY